MSEVLTAKKPVEAGRRTGGMLESRLPLGGLLRVSPFAMMREFASEMDRVFHSSRTESASADWSPTIDVQQDNGSMTVVAELPGVKKDEIKVEVNDQELVIEGERRREHQESHDGYYRLERSYGHFYRSIALPDGAKADQIKAELKEGLLRVSIPIAEQTKKSREVQVAG
jgi:HSP20 family protein